MSRLYDALKNAQASLPAPPVPSGTRAEPLADDGPMLRLTQAIDTRLADRPRRVIQVIGCTMAEDAGLIAKRLARLAAVTLHRTVLLLDAVPQPLAGRISHAHPAVAGLAAVPAMEPPKPLPPADDLPYALGRLSDQTEDGGIDPDQLGMAWTRLRLGYDLVVIDSPPVSAPLGLAVAPTVDGVVLVVEAEKTRAARAEAARDALIGGGANVLGVVMDQRRYWVPKPLWDRL